MTKPTIDILRRQIGKALLTAPLAIPLSAYAGSGSDDNTGEPVSGKTKRIRRQYVDGRFGQMHVYRIDPASQTGKTPLVCFHPTAVSGDYFRDFMLEMGSDRTVIAIDTPGYGRSDAPPEPQTMSELTGAIADALDALGYGDQGAGPVDTIGYHTGCYIATELAVIRPDLVRRLILPGIPYVVGKEREEQYKKNAKPKPIKEDGSGIMESWGFWVTDRQPEVSLERSAEHFTDYMQSGTRSWWAYHSVFTYEAEKRLPMVKQPVFIPNTHGSLKDQTREASKLFSDMKIMEIPELHHGIFDIGVELLSEVSRNFLDG